MGLCNFDQSHIVREFKRMLGYTPAQMSKYELFDTMKQIRGMLK